MGFEECKERRAGCKDVRRKASLTRFLRYQGVSYWDQEGVCRGEELLVLCLPLQKATTVYMWMIAITARKDRIMTL